MKKLIKQAQQNHFGAIFKHIETFKDDVPVFTIFVNKSGGINLCVRSSVGKTVITKVIKDMAQHIDTLQRLPNVSDN